MSNAIHFLSAAIAVGLSAASLSLSHADLDASHPFSIGTEADETLNCDPSNLIKRFKSTPFDPDILKDALECEAESDIVDSDRRRALLEQALWLNPRKSSTQLELLRHHVITGNYTDALDLTDQIFRTKKPDEQLYQVAQQVTIEIARSGLLRGEMTKRLGETPPWTMDFMNAYVAQTDLITDHEIGLLLSAIRSFKPADRLQTDYMTNLIRAGQQDKALAYWQDWPEARDARYQAALPDGMKNEIYNGTFRSGGAPAPYNWMYRNRGPNNFATQAAKGGLTISYRFNAPLPALEQTLKLQSGQDYRLNIRGAANARSRQSSARWTMSCLGETQSLFNEDIVEAQLRNRGFIVDFAIPETECDQQKLSLIISSKGDGYYVIQIDSAAIYVTREEG